VNQSTTVFCVLLISSHVASATDNWPSFQNGGKIVVESNNLPLQWNPQDGVTWSVELEGYGQSTPVVWGDHVYVTSCSGEMKDNLHIRALELTAGEKVWDVKLANSSREKNSNYVSRAAPTPVADAHGIIAFFEGGNVIALKHDGSTRWQRDLVQDYGPVAARHGLASSLEQNDHHVFVWVERSDSPYVLAIEKNTGKTLWKSAGVGKTAWSSPRLVPVGDSKHLVLSASGRIIGMDPNTGEHLWSFEDVANNTVATPIPLGDGRFLVGASEGRGEQPTAGAVKSNGLVKITKEAGGGFKAAYQWRAAKATSSFGSPIVVGTNAYFVSRAGVVYCLDAATGQQHYAKRSSGSVWATPLQVGNRIYLFGRNGTTTVISGSDEFKILATNSLWNEEKKPARSDDQPASPGMSFGGPVLYAAVVVDDSLLMRRGDRIYCVRN